MPNTPMPASQTRPRARAEATMTLFLPANDSYCSTLYIVFHCFSGNRSRGSFLVEVRTRLRSLSMRGYLLLLVFSVAIPGALFAAILLQRYYNLEVARINQDLLNNAHQLAQTVDRDLAGLQATLQTLALSPSLSCAD